MIKLASLFTPLLTDIIAGLKYLSPELPIVQIAGPAGLTGTI